MGTCTSRRTPRSCSTTSTTGATSSSASPPGTTSAPRRAASGCSSRCGSSSGWATASRGWATTAPGSTPRPARSSEKSKAKVNVMTSQNEGVFHLEGTGFDGQSSVRTGLIRSRSLRSGPHAQTSGGTGGRPPGGKLQLPVKNPYTGEVDYQITPPSAEELTELCDSLRAAQVKWGAASLEHRVEV